MYSNILVPMALDHGIGPSALDVARQLLSPGGKITALHVYETPNGTARAYVGEDAIKEAFQASKQELVKRVGDLEAVTPVAISGHAGRAIIDYAAEHDIDCVVMGSHKPGLIDYLLGSTAARVVRHAGCAVHVIRNT